MKKRAICLLLALAALLSLMPAVHAAASYELFYMYDGGQQMKVTGYYGTLPKKLVIPATHQGIPVTAIDSSAFKNTEIEELVLPDSVTWLGIGAVSDCASLRAATLGSRLACIYNEAFQNCCALTTISPLPETLTYVASNAFAHTALTELTIPASLKKIEPYAFAFVSQLRSLTISEGVEEIGRGAFSYCALEGRLVLPASIRTVEDAFYGNDALDDIVMLSDHASISVDSYSCVVYLHEDVTVVSAAAITFEELPYDPLTDPVLTEGPITYIIVDGAAYIIRCDAAGTYTLPDAVGGYPVRTIGPHAFHRAEALKKITLPDTVTEIAHGAFYQISATMDRLPAALTTIGKNAFACTHTDCHFHLPDCVIPAGVTNISPGTFCAADIGHLTLPTDLDTIGAGAFNHANLTAVTFGGSVRAIERSAFADTAITALVLPEGLERLADNALDFSHNLLSITLPRSVPDCGAFLGEWSYSLKPTLTIYGYADTPALAYCQRLDRTFVDRETGKHYLPSYTTTRGGVNYKVYPERYAVVTGLAVGYPAELVIPAEVDGVPVTELSAMGFSSESLTAITLPDTITSLPDSTLTHCPKLRSVRLPQALTRIGSYCFSSCENLHFLAVPASVTALGDGLGDCAQLLLGGAADSAAEAYARANHYAFVPMDADASYVSEGRAVCRIEGDAAILVGLVYTTHYDDTVTAMLDVPDTIASYPIIGIDGDVVMSAYIQRLNLGGNVRYIEPGALRRVTVKEIYTTPSLEQLPIPLFPDGGSLYGFTGSYAETYAAAQGLPFFAIDTTPFIDVPQDSWFFPWVFTCYWGGLMNGTSATTFSPAATASRAMLVTVLRRMVHGSPADYSTPFSDLAVNWYFDAVCWAYHAGVVSGTSATTFAPDAPSPGSRRPPYYTAWPAKSPRQRYPRRALRHAGTLQHLARRGRLKIAKNIPLGRVPRGYFYAFMLPGRPRALAGFGHRR